jgi:hypothetical protein
VNQQAIMDAMSSGLQGYQSGRESLAILLLIGFSVVMGGILLVSHYRFQLRAQWLYLKKKMRGQAVSKDRRRRSLSVVAQLSQSSQPLRLKTTNVSPRGMFVAMPSPLPVGEVFKFMLILGSEHIKATAEVRWSQPKRTPYTPPGIGCRIYNISEEDKTKLRRYLSRLAR